MLFLVLTAALAFYVTWNLGANDVANSMGTSVGSKAVTLRQALAIAGILEFSGAVLFGHRVSSTLATEIVDPAFFALQPQTLVLGMVSVLMACGAWLQVATAFGVPVASSHAVVGALAGFGWVAVGRQAVAWSVIGLISVTWILTPLLSGAIAALFYSGIRQWILDRPNPVQQLYEWIPWLSTALVSVFGFIVLPFILPPSQLEAIPLPDHDVFLSLGAIAAVTLTLFHWRRLGYILQQQDHNQQQDYDQSMDETGRQAAALPHSSTQPSGMHTAVVEPFLARFQILSACFVAFAHGSNDVGNGVAPLAAIAYIHRTGTVPPDEFGIPTWILVLGGLGIVSGLAVLGKNVIKTIGEKIIALQPSGGFCAELAAATTVLLASRAGLPVSTSHALVGAVVGIGLVQQWRSNRLDQVIQVKTLQQIALAWLVTLPIAAGLAAALFSVANAIF
ncbi:inorganic phosphate transporter [Oculatella sp. LEGE 06141]|uniref:inorganic phosphate transporter n=1 Tax=Oculatella sp. LEGE 06141 TaxID=1828648 RepID=UPI0018803FD8|nr:inorganic phosphate transporter [Oculatella sp. LEGE 06141]MBE9179944.1 inorganic phosphate transporter [Oculatella sp. LEGE 06141]